MRVPGSPGGASTDYGQDILTAKNRGYFDGYTTCECGLATEITTNMLQCSLLAHSCTKDGLIVFNDTGKQCVERWEKLAR